MLVPDQSHIDRIRDALWRRTGGGASVMIGAGFSRNARKAQPGVPKSPTWEEVTRRLFDKLYPQESTDNSQAYARNTSSSEKFLRLAQEYETAFGRAELHGFVRQLIRDDDHEPDEIHRRLLRLPWRDVFTTNWDTLIERASSSIPERKYGVVRNKEEIPLGIPPRIFKLHGSTPSPLILTEEDYRTYPVMFAPFVNTVQQAMMETIFCLVGFSGDDPNFLHWSGWVRDNMGESAPKIYLAGWLGLSNHRRRMLEDRNVVPIDLSLHPNASNWPEPLRHRYATEWILHTLEHGRRYDITEWPSPLDEQRNNSPIPVAIQPVTAVDSDKPKEEAESAPKSTDDDWLKQTKDVIEVWAHNRKVYPGWLIVPSSVFFLFNRRTDEWEPLVLRALPEFSPVGRLNAIRELVWRREISLVPISSDIESAADNALQLINCQDRTLDGTADSTVPWEDVREAWRYVALALVTAARHRFDQTLFKQRIQTLSTFRDDDPDVVQRVHHERCLWAVYSMDFQALEKLLEKWGVEHVDPFWMLRKAAILVEAGRSDEAKAMSITAFSQIREITDDEQSVRGSSREGWALFWMAARKMGLFWEEKEEFPTFSRFHRRWRELALRKCDALSEKDDLSKSISGRGEEIKPPVFDLNVRRGLGFRFSNEQNRRQIAARRAIRLSEVAGLPPSAFDLTMASDILKLAADELAVVEPETAARLVFRTVDYDQDAVLQRVLSRPRVAMMSQKIVEDLIHLCNGVIQYGLPRLSATTVRIGTISWTDRIRVALEAMSRLVLRLDPKQVEAIFDTTLDYYRDDRFSHRSLMLPLRRLLERSWETLLHDQRNCRVLDLLKAPIVGLDNFRQSFGSYDPDPGYLLTVDLLAPTRATDNEEQWTQIIGLLVRGLRAGGETRKRAAYRIPFVASWNRLTESDSMEIARALWDSRYADENGLPRDTNLPDATFLMLPQPEPALAEKRFRLKWLNENNSPQDDLKSLAENLWQVGNAISWLRDHKSTLHLSDDEKRYLIELVGRWADFSMSRHFSSFSFGEDPLQQATRRSIVGLQAIISEIVIPCSTASKLYEKIQGLNESGVPGFTLMAGIVNSLPNRFDEIVLSIRKGLVSDESDLAENAALGVFYWMKTSNAAKAPFPKPPAELVREIGVIIATRRSSTLNAALQIAEWIFNKGNKDQRNAISELVLQGLGYLNEELSYDRMQDWDENTVPSLRAHCARLALSAANHGFKKEPSVVRWLKTIENDPMPEVRYAKDRWHLPSGTGR